MTFQTPAALLLLLLLPPLWLLVRRRGQGTSLQFPATGVLAGWPPTFAQRLHGWLPWLRLLAIACAILALARPQWGIGMTRIERAGLTIAMAIDVSSSMRAIDLKLAGEPVDRLTAVKATFRDFMAARGGDAIGMVTFARYADSLAPPTLDHAALQAMLDRVEIVARPLDDGTAIGDALLRTVQMLRAVPSAGDKVLILLTDGSNNVGAVEPMVAGQIAAAFGIKIYAIGAGSQGKALIPVTNAAGGTDYLETTVSIDETTLRQLAELTKGRYFRAADGQALAAIYGEIDRLEKARDLVEHYQLRLEAFPFCLALAGLLLLLETLLVHTRLQTIP